MRIISIFVARLELREQVGVCSVRSAHFLQTRLVTGSVLLKHILVSYELTPIKHACHPLKVVLGKGGEEWDFLQELDTSVLSALHDALMKLKELVFAEVG